MTARKKAAALKGGATWRCAMAVAACFLAGMWRGRPLARAGDAEGRIRVGPAGTPVAGATVAVRVYRRHDDHTLFAAGEFL